MEVFLSWALVGAIVEIIAPALLEKETFVPLMIAVKVRHLDDPVDIERALLEAEGQLLRQGGFFFSDPGSLQEVVAIAGVGPPRRWSKITRQSATSSSGQTQVVNMSQGHPFIMGTEESTQEIMKLNVAVQEMMERGLGFATMPRYHSRMTWYTNARSFVRSMGDCAGRRVWRAGLEEIGRRVLRRRIEGRK